MKGRMMKRMTEMMARYDGSISQNIFLFLVNTSAT